MAGTGNLEIGAILIGLFGGLALFLYGMEQMTGALRIVAGSRMKNQLARLTTNRFTAVLTGAAVTSIIQSSSVTTVLVIGFISAGLMTLAQSIGVILGANIGTTITAQIIAFKVTKVALLLIGVGFFMLFSAKRERLKQYGVMVMGLGLIFFGMELMSEATRPLRTFTPFILLMQQLAHPMLGILIGALFTGIIQSSSATTGVVIVLAGQGFITLEAGIALIFGANIGTCVTAMLASIGKPREAVQAALVHVIFNVLGVLIWLPFIEPFGQFIQWISPSSPELSGIARLSAETPRQIANAHTFFNVINAIIFIWFTVPLAKLVQVLVPVRPLPAADRLKPKYLERILLETPEAALEGARLELGWLGDHILQMVQKSLFVVVRGTQQELTELAAMDDEVDDLYRNIVKYLGELSQRKLLAAQSSQAHDYMTIANYLESIGDMIETNLVEAGNERLKQGLAISPSTQVHLRALHNKVSWTVERSLQALAASDEQMAEAVITAKGEVNYLTALAENHIALRLVVDEPNRFDAFRIESEIIEYLKRVYYFAKRIAKVVHGDLTEPESSSLTAPPGSPVSRLETEFA